MSIVTGIYGGSFNPIHTGHTSLAQWLVEHHWVDELWMVVSPQNPFKQNDFLLPDEARLQMARIATRHLTHIEVSDIEFHLPKPSYMWTTLQTLGRRHPDREFVLIMGADNWERFPDWYHSEEILAAHRIILYPREGYRLPPLPKGVSLAPAPLFPGSSTAIRKAIQQGDFDGEGLDTEVWKAIQEHQYYQP